MQKEKTEGAMKDEFAWIGFVVTAMVGGVVGYIKQYEILPIEQSTAQKLWGISRRVFMAGFAGWMVWQFSIEFKFSSAWGHILSGITGMFAAEFFEVVWVAVKSRIEKKP
jgi:L-serine deaminase